VKNIYREQRSAYVRRSYYTTTASRQKDHLLTTLRISPSGSGAERGWHEAGRGCARARGQCGDVLRLEAEVRRDGRERSALGGIIRKVARARWSQRRCGVRPSAGPVSANAHPVSCWRGPDEPPGGAESVPQREITRRTAKDRAAKSAL
jgi:hypothetical protein